MADPRCGDCHKEHLGRDFRLLRFEPETFAHDSTGYTLRGGHAAAECRSCHNPEWITAPAVREFKGDAGALARTFLGLGTECASCHLTDDPHDGQFPNRSCDACHDEDGWDEALRFDHSRARYSLTGDHVEVACASCHGTEATAAGADVVRYRPLPFSDCRACHEDPHRGAMAGRCDGCHVTDAWARVRTERVGAAFDHASTGFRLEGAHGDAACESCHDPRAEGQGVTLTFRPGELRARSYPRPLFATCGSCHVDEHEGVFGDRRCDACHGQEAWAPSRFGLELHDRESRFALEGAHRVTPCDACHAAAESGRDSPSVPGAARVPMARSRTLVFRFAAPDDCRTCHREDDPHEGAFGEAACQACHGTDSFLTDTFDHDRPEVQPWIESCAVCHGDDQPHGEQFADRPCGECHGTEDFLVREFDHFRTRFPLDGAHQEVTCGECHRREFGPGIVAEGMVRYRPLAMACAACHTGAG